MEGLERCEAVESDRCIGRRVGAGAFDQDLVADLQADRQLVRRFLVEHVHGVAGRTGQHARSGLTAVARRADGIADRLVHGLREAAELADVEIDPSDLVGLALLRNEYDFSFDDPRIADHAAARFDDGFRNGIAEMLAQRPEYGISVGLHGRHFLEVLGRKAAAEIDHGELDAAFRTGAEDRGGRLERLVPSLRTTLLRPDVERHAVRLKAKPVGVFENVDRHRGIAAELARQRPFGSGAVEQEAAEHPRAWGGARDLLDLGPAIDREQANSEREGARNVTLLLDGVAIGNAVGRGAGCEHHFDFGDRSGVETGAEAGQQRQHFRRRVRLDGVVDPRVRQRVGESMIILAHHLKVDHKAWSVVLPAAQKLVDALRHGALPIAKGAASRSTCAGLQVSDDARWGRADERARNPAMLPWFGLGMSPIRTRGNDEQASSVARAGGWRTGRDQKSPLRRCFKPRPPWRTRYAGFASGCQSSVRSSNDPMTLRSSRSRSGRLSGLLSGCPPTDTRPQARAKLGNFEISDFKNSRKLFAPPEPLQTQKNFRSRSDAFECRLTAHHLAVVNGSTRIPLRTNATITATPIRKKTA